MGLSDWDKVKEKRGANLGFISRSNAFRTPSPAEIARAIIVETESWANTKGTKPYSISNEYKLSKGKGFNLLMDTERSALDFARAKEAYINTPMDDTSKNLLAAMKPKDFRYHYSLEIILSLILLSIGTIGLAIIILHKKG